MKVASTTPDCTKVFLNRFIELSTGLSLDEDCSNEIALVAKSHLQDLTTNIRGYYKPETLEYLANEAARRLNHELRNNEVLFPKTIRDSWRSCVVDFHRNGRWNTSPELSEKPKRFLNEEQLLQRKLFPYIWTLVQAAVIMKVVIYYFGIHATNDPSIENRVYLGLALAFSFGSLFYFALRKFRNPDDE